MQSNSDSALACYRTYYLQGEFDHWEDGGTTAGVCFGLKLAPDGTQEIALEGSHDAADWWHNFQVRLMAHPRLGGIDAGLYYGNDVAATRIKSLLDKSRPVRIVGHSRGGSNALYQAAELILDGYNVSAVAWNPPHTQHHTSTRMSEIFAGHDIQILRIEGDPVSEAPLEYGHPVAPQTFKAESFSGDVEGPMRYHHVHLCVIAQALQIGESA